MFKFMAIWYLCLQIFFATCEYLSGSEAGWWEIAVAVTLSTLIISDLYDTKEAQDE